MAKRRHVEALPARARRPAPDPTLNVAKLNKAGNRRQDDLRRDQEKLFREWYKAIRREMDNRAEHQRAFAILRAKHARQLAKAETRRVDSNRLFDRLEHQTASERQQLATDALDKATRAMATTLQAGTQELARTLAEKTDAAWLKLDGRVQIVEKAMAAGSGKAEATDPAMAKMFQNIETLLIAQAQGTGKSEGGKERWALISSLLSVALMLIALGTFFFVTMRAPAPAYAPAPVTARP